MSSKIISPRKCILPVLLFCLLKCLGVNAQTTVSGEQSGTWAKSGSPYTIDGSVTIPAGKTLTIAAGVEVRSRHAGDQIQVFGALSAKGTSVDSIRFTGFANAAEGTTRGGMISFASTAGSPVSTMQYVVVDKWGDENYSTNAIALSTGTVNILNCTIRNSGGTAISVGSGTTTKATISESNILSNGNIGIQLLPSSTAIVTNNKFSKNKMDIEAYPSGVSGISGCTNAAVYLANEDLALSATMPKPGTGAYFMLESGFSVQSGKTLTIAAGVEVRSQHYDDQVRIMGTLIAKGTTADSIRFTGFVNPQNSTIIHGGILSFEAGAGNAGSVLQYVAMNKWGDNNSFNFAVNISSGTVDISNSSIRNSGGMGVKISGGTATKASITATSIMNNADAGISIDPLVTALITNDRFLNNAKDIEAYPSSTGGISNCNNVAVYLQNETIGQSAAMSKPGTGSYYVMETGFTISTGTTLTVAPGVEIRSIHNSDQLRVLGTLICNGTAADSVRFTGYPDPLTPGSSHGGMISFEAAPGNAPSSLKYVAMDKWGDRDGYNFAIGTASGTIDISNSSIRNSRGMGISINGSADAKVSVTNCRITNNSGAGIEIGPSVAAVISNDIFIKNGKDIETYPSSTGMITNCNNAAIYLINETISQTAGISKPGTGAYYILQGGFTVGNKAVLTIAPGVEIRSTDYGDYIRVQGTLIAKGTQTDSIKFLGFTNPSNPGSTHGGLISFEALAGNAASAMQYAVIDKWGDSNGAQVALGIYSGQADISNSVVRGSGGKGIDIEGGTNTKASVTSSYLYNNFDAGIEIGPLVKATISDDKFANNGQDIEAYPSATGGISNCTNAAVYLLYENITQSSTINNPGPGSYYVLQTGFSVPSKVSLTIAPGVNIQSWSADDNISIAGTLIAKGTVADSIKFTGLADPQRPGSGRGGRIFFSSQAGEVASALQYVVIDGWGQDYYYSNAIIIGTSLISITNSSIRNTESAGIFIPNFALPSITLNTFANNSSDIAAVAESCGKILNNKNARISIIKGFPQTNFSWPFPGENSYYFLTDMINIPAGVTLTIDAGTLVDFGINGGELLIDGTLRAIGSKAAPIQFTSLQDVPDNQHSGIVYLGPESKNSVLSYVNISKIGNIIDGFPALSLATSDVSISNIKIFDAVNYGLDYSGGGSPVITGSDFFNDHTGIYVTSGSPVFSNCNIYGNTDYGILNESSVGTDIVDARNSYWGAPSGPYHGSQNAAGSGNEVSDKVLFKPFIQQPQNGLILDFGVSNINSPFTDCVRTAADSVNVSITNYGNSSQTNFKVSYRLNSGAVVSDTIKNVTILPGKTIKYTFRTKVNLSALGTYNLKAFTALAGDTRVSNDTSLAVIQHLKELTAPLNLLPANNAVKVDIPAVLSWSAVDGAAGYDIYVWQATDPVPAQPSAAGITAITYNLNSDLIAFNAKYNWKIVARRLSCSTSSAVQVFTTRALPDLIVQSISVPASATSETAMVVNWKTKNQGTGSTGSNQWVEAAYLSDQPVLGAGVTNLLIASPTNFSALAAGQLYTSANFSFQIPQGLQGKYYVIVQTNTNGGMQELNTGNNTAVSLPVNIALAPPPDLQVTSVIVAPLNAFSEDSVTVSYKVKNLGTGPTTVSNWADQLFISQSEAINLTTDQPLATFFNEQSLPVNSEYTHNVKIALPRGANGAFYIHVVTDMYNSVFEYNKENNNSGNSLPVNIISRPVPDLAARGPSVPPDTLSLNQPFSVSWTAANDGPADTKTSWTDYIYLSPTIVFNQNTAVVIATHQQPDNIKSLGLASALQGVAFPAVWNEGTWYLFVREDAQNDVYEGGQEGNNISAPSKPLHIVLPDLTPVSLTVPATASSEQTLNIQYSVMNKSRGLVYNSSWTDAIYLCKTPTFDSSTAALLSQVQMTKLLEANGQYNKDITVRLPSGVSGKYYILLVSDDGNGVFEKTETNNLMAKAVTISLSPSPDLKLKAITLPPGNILPGSLIQFSYTVTNAGAGTIDGKSWYDEVYFSTLNSSDLTNQPQVGAFIQKSTLLPGQSYSQNVSFNVAYDTAPGTYYLVVKSDGANTVFENAGETNNISTGKAITVVSPPITDLLVSGGSILSATATAGKPVNVQWTVKNNSTTATTAAWQDAVYLSSDPVLDQDDILLTTVNNTKPLAAATSYTQTASVNIPQNVAGTIYLLVLADKNNALNDNNRGNNYLPFTKSTGGQVVTVTLPAPADLIPTSFSAPANTQEQQPVTVSFTVKNNGAGTTASSDWTDEILLGTSAGPDGAIRLQSFPHTGALKPGASYTVNAKVTLPQGISGNYELLLKTDRYDAVFERGHEDNNVIESNILVKPQLASDLMVKEVIIPTGTQIAGKNTSISWRLSNIGPNAADGTFTDAVYFSKDSLLDSNDLLFGTLERYTYLAPGAVDYRTLQAGLTGITPGNYFVLVKTDILNNISEQRKNNNLAASVGKITISIQQLPLSILTPDVLVNNQPLYYRLDIPVALNNQTFAITLKADSIKNAVNRLFIKKDTVPTVNKYDYAAAAPFQANQQLIIPSLQTGTYYLMVTGNDTAKTNQPITLLAKSIPFSISSVDAPKGGNTGLVTVKISGARFEPDMVVKLNGTTAISAGQVYYSDQAKLYATFDLNNAALGKYTVILQKKDGTSVQLLNGFEVIAGTPGGAAGAAQLFTCKIQNTGFDESVGVDLLHPQAVRRNSLVKMTIAYTNNGNVDIPSQTRIMLSLQGAFINFDPDFTKQLKELFLNLVEPDGPPGILRAGTSGFINVYTKATAPMSFIITQ